MSIEPVREQSAFLIENVNINREVTATLLINPDGTRAWTEFAQ